ncbi:MAG: hypothetical protein U0174_12520 [Polyangiaceae bacterium]
MNLRLWLSCGAFSALLGVLYACSSDEVQNTQPAEKCDTYCSRMATTCTGSDVQFAGPDAKTQLATCMRVCSNWVIGKVGEGGDTLACRSNILSSTAELDQDADAPQLAAGCSNAGPFSDGCGGRCETLCRLNALTCSGTLSQFSSEGECITQCKGLKGGFDSPLVIPKTASGNTVACRGYHTMAALGAAATDPSTHCPHTKMPTSPVCFDTTPVSDGGADATTD